MMKTLADTLVEYRTRFLEMREDKARWGYFGTTAQIMASEIEGLTDDDPAIIGDLQGVIAAAQDMQAGRNLTARVMRSDTENDRLFGALMDRMNELRNQLRTARPASDAKLMGRHLDQTQVPDPF